jgi:hypothetical protein
MESSSFIHTPGDHIRQPWEALCMKVHLISRAKPLLSKAPRVLCTPRHVHVARSGPWDALLDQSAIVGRGMILFVLFASSMNWWHYREVRKSMEEKDKDP